MSMHKQAQLGFSLVELMVALTIGLLVSGAVLSIFVSSLSTNKSQDGLARLQENARYVLNQIQTDTRMAGYRGCLGRKGAQAGDAATPINNIASTINYTNNMDLPIEGFHSSASTWAPALDATIAANSPASDSDIITIRFGSGTGTALSAQMTNSAAAIPIVANPDNLSVGDTVMVADCVASTVFTITGITNNSIEHSTSANTTADLSRAFSHDAVVMPISTVTYYVAPSADTSNGLSLWRKTNNQNSEELADNIEQLKILYGEDGNGDLSPDHYVTANNVSDMRNVIAIKLMMLARTSADNLSISGQNYTFNGQQDITPADKRIRRTFNMIITLRNRAS